MVLSYPFYHYNKAGNRQEHLEYFYLTDSDISTRLNNTLPTENISRDLNPVMRNQRIWFPNMFDKSASIEDGYLEGVSFGFRNKSNCAI